MVKVSELTRQRRGVAVAEASRAQKSRAHAAYAVQSVPVSEKQSREAKRVHECWLMFFRVSG